MLASNKTIDHKTPFPLRTFTTPGLVSVIILSTSISGCTVSSQLDTASLEDKTVTNSISQQAKQDGLNESDAETIKSTVIAANLDGSASHTMAWANPETGNSGQITSIKSTQNSQGNNCRKFETTVKSFSGVTIYTGETCRAAAGSWSLSWLMPKDFGI